MSPNIDRRWLRAQRYIADNQIDAAKVTLESIVSQSPNRYDAHMLLASVILSEGHVREASRHALIGSQFVVDDIEALGAVAHCLLRLGEMAGARDCLRKFDPDRITDSRQLLVLAHVFQKLGDQRSALTLMNRVDSLGYNDADFRYFRALQLLFNGQVDDARSELSRCLQLGPTYGRAVLTLTRTVQQTPQANYMEYVARQLDRVAPGSEDHAALEFARFEIAEDLGKFDEAFSAVQIANSIMYKRLTHSVDRDAAVFQKLIAKMTAKFLNPAVQPLEGPQPIFIVGLPRSGTTLLDRILDRHSMVISAGERNDFPKQLRWMADRHGHEILDEDLLDHLDDIDYAELACRYLAQTQWRAGGFPYFVDKLPPNYVLIGLIHRAFPRAPILHMTRDGMDVCFSNYKAMFGDTHAYSYDIAALASRYNSYRALMTHWHAVLPGRVLDVEYRDLVSNPDRVIAAILEHCHLPDEPACGNLGGNKTAADTLSSAQIHESIHTRSLGEWRRYAHHLKQLHALIEMSPNK